MAIMNYVTSGISKIEFEDSLFVLTDIGRDNMKDVQALIENRGGIVKGSVTKSTNYLIYGDGEEETIKYKKALELINDKGLEINVFPLSLFWIVCRGQGLVEFGIYPFDADGTKRPIHWVILKQDGNKALLRSVYGLDVKPYNEERKDITWENCSLRKWLNEEFINTAFNAEEQQRIITTKLENADNLKYKTPGGNDTEDMVFSLSLSEVEEYLQTGAERAVLPTPYAVAQGADKDIENNYCSWWLRSPGEDPYLAAGIYGVGGIFDYGFYVNCVDFAVCPAIWVNLESETK